MPALLFLLHLINPACVLLAYHLIQPLIMQRQHKLEVLDVRGEVLILHILHLIKKGGSKIDELKS
jgi:hypothetical protein